MRKILKQEYTCPHSKEIKNKSKPHSVWQTSELFLWSSYLLVCRWMEHLIKNNDPTHIKTMKNDHLLNKETDNIPQRCSDDLMCCFPPQPYKMPWFYQNGFSISSMYFFINWFVAISLLVNIVVKDTVLLIIQ